MNIQHETSITVLTVAAIGLLVSTVVSGRSSESAIQLAGSSAGRIALHLVCFWKDHHFLWHWHGIQREFGSSRVSRNQETHASLS